MRNARWTVAGAGLVALAIGAGGPAAFAGKGGKPGGGDGGTPAPLVIAFLQGGADTGSLMACAADGSGRTTLLAGSHHRPSWSPDGSLLAFASGSLGTTGIYTYAMADGATRFVTAVDGSGPVSKVAWAPAALGADDYVLAFTDVPEGDTETDVFLVALDGTRLNLTNSPGVSERHPAWSPDATRIAFSRSTTRDTGAPIGYADDEIVVLDVDVVAGVPTAGDELVVSELSGSPLAGEDVRQPSWSRDGTRLAVKTGGGSGWNGDVWIVDLDAPTSPTNVTSQDGFVLTPCWSADDAQLVYNGGNADHTDGGSIWTLDLATGSRTEIVVRGRGKTSQYNSHPDWKR